MTNVWDRFESIVSAEEVVEQKSKFENPVAGDYIVILESLVPSESSSGLPMLKGRFRSSENKVIFYNQMLQNLSNPQYTAMNVAQAVSFVEALVGESINFTSLSQLAQIVTEMEMGGEYKLNVSYGDKDTEQKFPRLKITEIISKGVGDSQPIEDDENIPF